MATQTLPRTDLPGQEALKSALDRAIADGDGIALAVIDVDHVAALFHRYGPHIVSRVLDTLASILSETAPGEAYGLSGDEYAIRMPGMSLERAFLRMEDLRRQVADAREQFGLPDNEAVTVTVGVAHSPRDARDEEALMRAAVAALLGAKELGGNQVALAPSGEMVMKSCYYSAASLRHLKALAERLGRKESVLLREALDDLLRRHSPS
jgi:diguanylate cyclase (GGDEF)-like protein